MTSASESCGVYLLIPLRLGRSPVVGVSSVAPRESPVKPSNRRPNSRHIHSMASSAASTENIKLIA